MHNQQACDLLDVPDEYLSTNPTNSELFIYMDTKGEFAESSDEQRSGIKKWIGSNALGKQYNYERRRPNGTWLQYVIRDNGNIGNTRWTAPVKNGELMRRSWPKTLRPGCFLHCSSGLSAHSFRSR